MARSINCDDLTFSLYPYAHEMKMYESYYRNGSWNKGAIVDFHEIALSPAANILNYGQGIFEGMKAYYSVQGHIVMFRPEENARRFRRSAQKLAIPDIPEEKFLDAVRRTVIANRDFVPKSEDGRCSMYLRPVCIGIEPLLGVRAALEYLFFVYASPVGPYFDKAEEKLGVVKLTAKNISRATPNGTGDAKAVCNYPVTMAPKKVAKKEGFDDVIYLDPCENKYIEEAGVANFFALMEDDTLVTPQLGSILPGITRDSIIQLARREMNLNVEERKVSVEEVVKHAKECFVSGTGAIITPVSHIGWQGTTYDVNRNNYQLAHKLYNRLTGIQFQREDDPYGWVTVIV